MLREDHAVNAAAQSGPVQAVETMLRQRAQEFAY
jgi:hypothetical protein